uniref:NADH-ubiquinone oxidoreductase chain 1 n=1 Tax=Pujadella villari TaxID=2943468 RepID=A0A9E8G8T8_9HYME|nr:NADH dehydrogenase subunit 1 [Pujadella villari]
MNMNYYLNNLIINMLMIIGPLISLAFLTLLERKILGFTQLRKGPNKPSLKGLLQPFSDAIKLYSKELFLVKNLNYMFFLMSPILSLLIMLMLWIITPMYFNLFYLDLNITMFLSFLSLNVYTTMISGWSSNSSYSMLGSVRAISQTISYEVSLILIILVTLILTESFNMNKIMIYQTHMNFIFYLFPVSLMFFISMTAELNRTPFDLAEGESELVSGFNTEYMSGPFALIFMAEYGMIMIMSFMFTLFYWTSSNYKIMFFVKMIFMMNLIILLRSSMPRFRYDKLMMLTWKSFLPSILNLLIYFYFLKIFLMII